MTIKGLSGPEIERLKKNVVKTFKDYGLNVTIEANLHAVNYLDVTFDLRKGTYLPYRKPDNPPVYINSCSNHPPTVIKQLPRSISKRLSDLSYNPPYSANIKTNIGKTFLNLIKKHFPKTSKLHKILNKNTAKISYSCMNNISSVISRHNKNLLNPKLLNMVATVELEKIAHSKIYL